MVSLIEAPEPAGHAPAQAGVGKPTASPEDGGGARPEGFEALMALLVGASPPTPPADLGPDRSPEAPRAAAEGAHLDTDAEASETPEAVEAAAARPTAPPDVLSLPRAVPASAAASARTAPAADAARAAGAPPTASPPDGPRPPNALPAPVAEAAGSARAGRETADDARVVPPPTAGSAAPEDARRAAAARPAQPAHPAQPAERPARGAPSSSATPAQAQPHPTAPPPRAARADAPPVPAARRPEHARAGEVESPAARLRPELAATVAQALGGAEGAAAVDELEAAGRSSLAAQLADSVELAATRGPRELRVQLRPAELGQITIRVVETEGGLRVAIEAALGEVEELLLRQLPALRAALEARELRIDRLDVQRGDLGEPGLAEREQPRGGGEREAEPGRSDIPAVPAEDSPDVAAAASSSNQRVGVRV